MPKIDLSGQKFSYLKVISFAFVKGHNNYWNCQCDCGKKKIISVEHLRGTTKSCGCMKGKIRSGNAQRIEKMQKTMLVKYGVINAMHDKDISLKNAKSQNNSYILYHWKTNEEVVCVGSYEKKTVEWLNANHLQYQWQPEIFTMPDGRTYRPDFYLSDRNQWIEVKGFMRKDAQEKYDWFKSFNNCEIWNKEKLKEIGVLRG